MKNEPAPSEPMAILRRLGPDPHAGTRKTIALSGCPDLFELRSGDFLVVGTDVTETARNELPTTASCGPDERIIQIPRSTLVLARPDIPETL